MSEPLTQLERNVYHFLIDYLAANTYQPSIRDIARQFRIKSTKTVSDLLRSLETKGFIERDESRSRGVRLLGFATAGRTQPVPLYERIHAGESPLRDAHRAGFITVDRRFLPSEDVFMMRAGDANMTGRGIFNGDYVMVSPSAPASDGDVVAARVGGEVTIRTLTHRGAAIGLEMASDGAPAPSSIEVGPRDDFAILGVVCGVFRPYWEREPQSVRPREDAPLS